MKFLKIKSADMPTKPKPTEQLPNNLMYVWDPNANDWIILQKDTNKATPPLYDPNNQNVVNQNTSYMGTVKSASDKNTGYIIYKINPKKQTKEQVSWEATKEEAIEYANELLKWRNLHEFFVVKDEKTDETVYIADRNKMQASCLAKFLDCPQYSKEIKIEAGLIKQGLVKYAGFDFNRGTKYAITTKGLEVLRRASEAEHNEALNEREKLAYMFGFNTDEVSTLDTTGKVIKQSARKWTIYEADGLELGEVEADSELDAKVKFGTEHPEYADSQSICAKEIKSSTKFIDELTEEGLDAYNFVTKLLGHKLDLSHHPLYGICDLVDIDDINIANKINDKFGASGNFITSYSGKWGDGNSYWIGFENKKDTKKEVDAQYEETTNTKEPYPNPSETPNDHIILENHDGWVNTAKLENKDTYRKLFSLAKILEEYKEKNLIYDTPSEDDDIVFVSGDAKVINELEHKLKNIGFYCEPIEQANTTFTGLVYSLKIFLK